MSVLLAVLGILMASAPAPCRETEDQLLQHIQNETNPVKKAKDEIKLASLRFVQVRDEYTDGRIDSGAKLLGTFMGDMKNSWKLLQDSGRKAWKQPEGFRELEISLREDVRLLQDLARSVSYFDRGPLLNAAEQLEHMRDDVLRAQFPGGNPRTIKNAAASPATQGSGGISDHQ
jgi:hypothetical protein